MLCFVDALTVSSKDIARKTSYGAVHLCCLIKASSETMAFAKPSETMGTRGYDHPAGAGLCKLNASRLLGLLTVDLLLLAPV